MNYCPSCGKSLAQDQKFCSSCGSPIAASASKEVELPLDSNSENILAPAKPYQESTSVADPRITKRKKSFPLAYVFAAIIGIVIIGFIYTLYFPQTTVPLEHASKPIKKIDWIKVEGGPTGDFNISATEVTFAQFDEYCDATGYTKPKANFGRGKQPVINVTVADAMAFCAWLSKETGTNVRLPEVNEWAYAAQGGNRSKKYEYSGSNIIDEVAWNAEDKTHEVATKKPNELGIYDMSGNVWEWCGTSGLIRGGSYLPDALGGGNCRVSYPGVDLPALNYSNYAYPPDSRHGFGGFRVLQK